MLTMSHPISRQRSAHDVGEGWTAADAAELYEIARWGQGYFAIGDNGVLGARYVMLDSFVAGDRVKP